MQPRLAKLYTSQDRSCRVGGRDMNCDASRHALYDARGIFCTYVCDKCEPEKKSGYRPDIFTDANYWHDEPIEED
jgi:hypothetical protein